MRAALYIDANTINVGYIPAICSEISRTDELAKRECFGCWDSEGQALDDDTDKEDPEDAALVCAEDIIKELHLSCRSLFQDDDFDAIVDMVTEIMFDAAGGLFDKIYIATTNSVVTPLIDRLRLMNIHSVVFGDSSADRTLISAAERFVYADVLIGKKCTANLPDITDIAKEIYSISSYYKSTGGEARTSDIYSALVRKYPDFDVRNYGYTHLSTFIQKNVAGVNVCEGDNGTMFVKAIDDRDEIERYAYAYMTENNYVIEDMAELIEAIKCTFPGFSISNYGYQSDYGFILSFPKLEISGNKGVKMKRSFRLSRTSDEGCE